MNRPIRKVAIALLVLLAAMFVNLNFVQVVKGSDYRNDPDNKRVLLAEYSNPRGQIVVQGTAIAASRPTKDELKYLRTYPHGAEYAAITGYYSFVYGTSAMENAENSLLSGDDSRLFGSQLADLFTGRNPRGGSVELTLNKDAQTAAYNAMKNPNGTFRAGAVVALDPTTGAILAAVSTPSYNPSLLSAHNASAITHAYGCLSDLQFARQGDLESDAAYQKRVTQSINAQLVMRRGGTTLYLADHKRDPAGYPLDGLLYIKADDGTETRSTVPFFTQFGELGKSGCGDVPGDPTSTFAANQHAYGPLDNRAFNQLYAPGSVFKVIDSAAALKKGITPTQPIAAANSYWPLDPKRTDRCPANHQAACVENFEGETCQNGTTATLTFALAKSCNTAFAALAVDKLGAKAIKDEAALFGFDGPKLETPLGVSTSTVGTSADLNDKAALAQTSFGQRDVRMTPMQAAMISAAVANQGTLMKPYLVAKELGPNLSVLKATEPKQMSQVIDPTLDGQLQAMMREVVTGSEGTGGPANITDIPGVTVGGKTGTADTGFCQVGNKVGSCSEPAFQNGTPTPPHAWFSGFATENGNPKIAVAVIIENGGVNGNETTGGLAAAPVAKQVMEAYLKSTAGH